MIIGGIKMKEIWVDIKGYEGRYQVSNLGRVRSLDRIILMRNGAKRLQKGQLIKPTKDQYGYLKVHLSKNDKKKMFRVHKLVAEHFIEKPEGYEDGIWFVNRKDKDLNNNRVDNLYWEKDTVSLSNAGKIGGKATKRKMS